MIDKENYKKIFETLECNGFYNECVQVLWRFFRGLVFDYLYVKKIEFDSTERAVLEFIKVKDLHYPVNSIHYLYCLSIMCEWDNEFSLSKKEYSIAIKKIDNLFNLFNEL